MLFVPLNTIDTFCIVITDINTDKGSGKWKEKEEKWAVTISYCTHAHPLFFFLQSTILLVFSTSMYFACGDLDIFLLQTGIYYYFVNSGLKPCLWGGKGKGIYMQIKFYPLMDLHSQHVPQHTIISIYIRHSDHISEAFIFHPLMSEAIRIRFHILMRTRSQQYHVSHCRFRLNGNAPCCHGLVRALFPPPSPTITAF